MQTKNAFTPWISWGLTTAFVLVQFFLQAAAGLMAKSWQHDFNLTPTALGYLTSAFYLTYVFMQIPVGYCYDRFKARPILCYSSALLSVGILCLGFSQNFWQAFIARLLMGIGSSFGFVGMLYVTSSWFSVHRFALLVGVAETAGMIGVALVEVGMGWIMTHYNWRLMMLLSGALMTIIHLMMVLFVQDKDRPEVEKSPFTLYAATKKVLSFPIVWKAGMYGFAMFAIINVVVSLWGVPFLGKHYPQLSLQSASFVMSLIFIGTGIGAPLSGWLSQYFNRQSIMAGAVFMTLILFGCFIYIPHLSTLTLGMLLFFVGLFSANYIQVFAIIREQVHITLQATALAAVNMIFMISAPLLQPLVGKLLEMNFTFPEALSVITITLFLAFIFSLDLKNLSYKKLRNKKSK